MFRELHSHPQESLNKRHLVYCVRVFSVGCTRVKVELVPQTLHACEAPPEDEQVMLETCTGH
jgi:hypothetical protein